MAYKLEAPYTEDSRKEFIIKYNYNLGLNLEETNEALFALEAWEIMQHGQPVKNPNYEKEQEQKEKERISTLSMTKYDFFKHVCKPYGVSYSELLQIVNSNQDIKAAWELCARVYRGDELLCANASKFIPGITESILDEIFKRYGE